MKLREVLTRVDMLRPNAYTEAEKIDMLNMIEGKIYREVIHGKEGEEAHTFRPFKEGEEERELFLPLEFTKVYIYGLAAEIDFLNGDNDRYNDTIYLFQQEYEQFAEYYIRRHRPKGGNRNHILMTEHGR